MNFFALFSLFLATIITAVSAQQPILRSWTANKDTKALTFVVSLVTSDTPSRQIALVAGLGSNSLIYPGQFIGSWDTSAKNNTFWATNAAHPEYGVYHTFKSVMPAPDANTYDFVVNTYYLKEDSNKRLAQFTGHSQINDINW